MACSTQPWAQRTTSRPINRHFTDQFRQRTTTATLQFKHSSISSSACLVISYPEGYLRVRCSYLLSITLFANLVNVICFESSERQNRPAKLNTTKCVKHGSVGSLSSGFNCSKYLPVVIALSWMFRFRFAALIQSAWLFQPQHLSYSLPGRRRTPNRC